MGINIKEHGSRSIGATNVLRVVKQERPDLAKLLTGLTFAFDFLKGGLLIIIAKLMGFDENVLWMMGFLSVVGHCFSPYLFFEGGKGIATGVGVVIVLLPIEAILGLLVWFLVGKKFKISSISSLIGMMVAVGTSFFIHPDLPGIGTHVPIVLIGFIIFYKHIPNIIRLFQKKETTVI